MSMSITSVQGAAPPNACNVYALYNFAGTQNGPLPSGYPASGKRVTMNNNLAQFCLDSTGKITNIIVANQYVALLTSIGILQAPGTSGMSSSSHSGACPADCGHGSTTAGTGAYGTQQQQGMQQQQQQPSGFMGAMDAQARRL